MSRKQVVSLTSAILMVALITTVVWIHNAEANPSKITTVNVTHACVDTTPPYPQNDVCKITQYSYYSYMWPWAGHQWEDPHGWHLKSYDEIDKYTSEHVTSCSQCSW